METLTLRAEIAVIGTINRYWCYSHSQNCSSRQNMETLTFRAEIAVIGTINRYWFYSHRQNCSSRQNMETLTFRAEIAVIGTITVSYTHLTLPRASMCRSRWSPYH